MGVHREGVRVRRLDPAAALWALFLTLLILSIIASVIRPQ